MIDDDGFWDVVIVEFFNIGEVVEVGFFDVVKGKGLRYVRRVKVIDGSYIGF